MNEGELTIELCGESLNLLPERAIHWPARRTLFVADPHWGKAATFRSHGIPVPSGTTDEGISRLDRIVQRTNVSRIIFLGDLLHAKAGRSRDLFAALGEWRRNNADADLLLVRGNHDQRAGDPPEELRIRCTDAPFVMLPFVLDHHPRPSADGHVLAGHVHPGIRIFGVGRQMEKLPCFHVGPAVTVLPAFGDFTGLAIVEPEEGDSVYAIAESAVIPIVQREK